MEFGCESQINEIGWDSEIVIWLTVKLNDDLTATAKLAGTTKLSDEDKMMNDDLTAATAKFDCHSEFGCHNQIEMRWNLGVTVKLSEGYLAVATKLTEGNLAVLKLGLDQVDLA